MDRNSARARWLLLAATGLLAACESQGPFEEAGEDIDEAIEDIEDEIDDAFD